MYKHISPYSSDVFNNYKINKTQNVKKHIIFLLMVVLLISIIPLTLMTHTI